MIEASEMEEEKEASDCLRKRQVLLLQGTVYHLYSLLLPSADKKDHLLEMQRKLFHLMRKVCLFGGLYILRRAGIWNMRCS